MEKDFLTITPGSGSGNGSLNVVAAANTGAARSSSVVVSGSGVTKTVPVTQELGGVPLTYFAATLVNTVNLEDSITGGNFRFGIGVYDINGDLKAKSIEVTPGTHPSGSGIVVEFGPDDNIIVADPHNTTVLIRVFSTNGVDTGDDNVHISQMSVQSIIAAQSGWHLTPITIENNFTRTVAPNRTTWNNPKTPFGYATNINFNAILLGGVTSEGSLGNHIVTIS